MACLEGIAWHKELVGNCLKFSFPWCLLGIQGKKKKKSPFHPFLRRDYTGEFYILCKLPDWNSTHNLKSNHEGKQKITI